MKGSEGVMDSMDERDRQMLLEVKEQTARILERLGYEKIYNLKGGLENNMW